MYGNSMAPTINEGDILNVSTQQNPQRFDIVVFANSTDTPEYNVKRIIGLPGEKVEIIDGDILINGEIITEPYLREEIQGKTIPKYQNEFEVPPMSYFVLGDNRTNTSDSRNCFASNPDELRACEKNELSYYIEGENIVGVVTNH